MSHADDHNTPNTEVETSPTTPSWLKFLNERIEEEEEAEFSDPAYHEIVRDLLLDPDNDERAVPKAIESFRSYYQAGFAAEDYGMRTPPDYAAGDILNAVSVIVFEAMEFVSFTDFRHDRLANFLIGLKSTAAQEFDLEDPQFVYFGWGLETAATESWNAYQASGWTQDSASRTALENSNDWINTAALLAKLFKGGLLDSDGPLWIWADLENAFVRRTHGDIATNIGRKAQILATANYILIAGEALLKEVKTPSRKWRFELSAAKWKFWASKFQEIADTVGEDAEWDLKTKTQEAHDKMVELYPEAFKEDL